MVAIQRNNVTKPIISLWRRTWRKSSSAYREVRMDKNIRREVVDMNRAIASETTKMINAFSVEKIGSPLVLLFPPGTVIAATNTIAVMSVAAIVHEASPIPVALGNLTGNLVRFNTSSYVGNKDLYGYPLPPLKSKGLSIMAIVGIGLGSGLLSLVLCFSVVCIWLRVSEQNMTVEEGKISQLMPDY
ncbi:Receptor-like protein 44 [Camellia lanceoleosa]|uniref:Receptor-like protein 44 n=1 Tax=Camellia lanceoleosa TaxID=1840588 RepID=A0ACC0IV77_9ERIC|nr:Receptor-like protein 44 [Camellia lanceoleosa]